MYRPSIAGSAAALLMTIAIAMSPSTANADVLLVGGSTVTAEKADDGSFSAKVELLNTGPENVDLSNSFDLDESCTATLGTTRLSPLQSTTVELALDKACFDDIERLKIDLDGRDQLPAVTVKVPTEDSHDWTPLAAAAVVALFAALVVVGFGDKTRHDVDEKLLAIDEAVRRTSYETVKAHVGTRMAELSDTPLSWKDTPERNRFDWKAEVEGLDAGWSFQDSWVSNLTVAATGFVALATSADAFTALLGEEPKASLRVMVVAGLISAAVIALANTVVKLFGSSTSKVTVAGLVASTSLVVFAAILQAVTVGVAANSLVTGIGGVIVIVLMVAVSTAVLVYAFKSLREALAKGTADSLPSIPDEALENWKATAVWEKQLVEQSIRKEFKTWLEEDSYPTASPTLRTSPGDEIPVRRRQASLL